LPVSEVEQVSIGLAATCRIFDREKRTLAGADSDAVLAFLFIDGMTDTMRGSGSGEYSSS
jgi:hypothetical protein